MINVKRIFTFLLAVLISMSVIMADNVYAAEFEPYTINDSTAATDATNYSVEWEELNDNQEITYDDEIEYIEDIDEITVYSDSNAVNALSSNSMNTDFSKDGGAFTSNDATRSENRGTDPYTYKIYRYQAGSRKTGSEKRIFSATGSHDNDSVGDVTSVNLRAHANEDKLSQIPSVPALTGYFREGTILTFKLASKSCGHTKDLYNGLKIKSVPQGASTSFYKYSVNTFKTKLNSTDGNTYSGSASYKIGSFDWTKASVDYTYNWNEEKGDYFDRDGDRYTYWTYDNRVSFPPSATTSINADTVWLYSRGGGAGGAGNAGAVAMTITYRCTVTGTYSFEAMGYAEHCEAGSNYVSFNVDTSTDGAIKVEYPHTLIYNANGGNNAPEETLVVDLLETSDVTVSSSKPTRTGYNFVKWNTKADGTGIDYYAGNNVSINAYDTVILYAQWTSGTSPDIPPTPTQKEVKYTVKHFRQNRNGEYESESNTNLFEQQTFTSHADEIIRPSTKSYRGFTTPNTQEVKLEWVENSAVIRRDGGRVVVERAWDSTNEKVSYIISYYYIRNKYPVTYIDMVAPEYTNDGTAQEIARYTTTPGGWEVSFDGIPVKEKVWIQDLYYETPVMAGTQIENGNDYHGLGTVSVQDRYYRHFAYESESPMITVDIENNVVYRYFRPQPITFYVAHKIAYYDVGSQQYGYTVVQRKAYKDHYYGETVTINPEQSPYALDDDNKSKVEGYEKPGSQTITLDSDMQTVNFIYMPKPATVKIYDMDISNGLPGSQLSSEPHVVECRAHETVNASEYRDDYINEQNPYQAQGYALAGGTSGVSESGKELVLYRHFVKNGTKYTVHHHRQVLTGGQTYEGEGNLKYDDTVKEEFSARKGTSVTPDVKTSSDSRFTGYISPKTKTVAVADDGSTHIHYFYLLDTYDVTYVDQVYGTETVLGTEESSALYGSKVSGSDLGTDTTTGKYYEGYQYKTCTEAVVGSDGETVVYRYFVSRIAGYTVRHEQEQIDGSYKLVATSTGQGDIGQEVHPDPVEYTGFTTPEKQSAVIKEDGSTVITYQYRRNRYPVTFIDMVSGSNKELGRTTEDRLFGEHVSGAEKGTSSATGAYYPDYSYVSSTDATVSIFGASVCRYFSKNNATYRIIHRQETLNGDYETVKDVTERGNIGSTVSPVPEEYTGFKTPPRQSAVIAEDNSTTIIYTYTRNKYDVTYVDMVYGTTEELGRSVESKPYGMRVAGSDKGSLTTVGIYYGNYVYHSSTSDTVRVTGTTVFRYFTSNSARYTVYHEQEQGDGSYVLVDTTTGYDTTGSTVTPKPNYYEGFTKPEEQTLIVKADNSASITYQYRRNRYPVTFIDVSKESGEELGRKVENMPFGIRVYGSQQGNDTRVGAYYDGYTYSGCTDAVVGTTGTTVYRYFIAGGTKYTVIHQQEQLDGTYKTVEIENCSEKAGTEVTPPTRGYKGFTSPEPQTITVNSNGSSSITYKYKRNSYYVTYIDRIKDTTTNLSQGMEKKPFGMMVSGADKGTSTMPGAYHDGYVYDSCTQGMVDVSGTVVYRYFISSNVGYTVTHQQEQLDGSYLTVQTEKLKGEAGAQVTPPTMDYEGFTSPDEQTITINEDGSSSVIYKYKRNKYKVTYIDRVKDTTINLGSSTEEKPYGSQISGSDKGILKEVGAYYQDYAYDSCTSDTVRTSGNTVYRYFVSKVSGLVVYHQQEQFDGTYLTIDIDTIKAIAGEKVTPDLMDYTGFVKPEQQTVTVADDGSTKVIYKYSRKTCKVTYIDRIKDTSTELGRTTGDAKYGQAVYGSDIGDSRVIGAYYDDYAYVSCTNIIAGLSNNIVYRDFASNIAQYTVEHQQQQLDGTYKTVETEKNGAEINSKVTPDVRTYDGFTSPETQTIIVKDDGTSKVVYQYSRNKYRVTYVDRVSGTITDLGQTSKTVLYGTKVAGSDIGNDKTIGRYYDGYAYADCTSDTVTVSGTVVYRFFILKESGYKVYHYQQQISGEYTLIEMNTMTGEAGTSVTPSVNHYVGFTSPSPQTITISADGASSVTYKYSRNSYPVLYIDMVKQGRKELGRTERQKQYGDFVSGSDLGSSMETGAYYDGYAYTSCTTEIVDVENTTVYRYFVERNQNVPDEERAEYKVFHKQEQIDGSYITVENEILMGTVGTSVTPSVRKYSGFISPAPQTITIRADGTSEVVYLYNISKKNADYKVYHQQQQLDGTYTTVETETHSGIIGQNVTPDTKTYTGFMSPDTQNVVIKADGSTAVIYKYKRWVYPMVYIDIIKDTDIEIGRLTDHKPYGSFVSGADMGTDAEPDVYYKGYIYSGCTSATVTGEGVAVYRYFVETPKQPDSTDANYRVLHQQEQLDGTFLTVDSDMPSAEAGSKVTPPVNAYENFESPEPQTVIVAEDGSTTVIYRYIRKEYQVRYIDMDKDGQKELGHTDGMAKYGMTVSGADKGENKTPGAYYKDYSYVSCTTATVGSSRTVVYRYFEKEVKPDVPKKTEYKVIYQEEQLDGTYITVETEILEGEPGKEVTVAPDDKDGYENPLPQTVVVKEDGSTEITIKYERKKYDVVYIDIEKGTKTELGKTVEKIKWGTTVSGADKGTDKTMDAYYKGYYYDSCTSDVVKKGETTTVYRYFVKGKMPETPEIVKYKVVYEEEQLDGTYKTVFEEELSGAAGTKVTAEPKPKEGFETPKAQTVTINKDGTTVITYKYERKSYPVIYVDMVKGTKQELGKTVEEKKFESSVSGLDLGTDKTAGAYYKGYVYDSCTSATVTISGATVYRYFVNEPKTGTADYTIIYQEEQPDGTYVTVEIRVENGVIGDKVTVKPDERDGFITPSAKSVTITADGKATVTFKYDRIHYKVTYIDLIKDTKKELGRTEIGRKWETIVKGSDIGASKTVGAYYADYIYDSCTSATVTKSGATVYRYFVKKAETPTQPVTPNAGQNKPNTVVQKPTTTTQKPATTTQKPATTTQKPATTTQKPVATTQKPTTAKPNNIVKTGESSAEMIFIIIAGVMTVAGCGLLVWSKRKKK